MTWEPQPEEPCDIRDDPSRALEPMLRCEDCQGSGFVVVHDRLLPHPEVCFGCLGTGRRPQ